MGRTLYIVAFVAIPLLLVILLLAFDRLLARMQAARPHRVWTLVALMQVPPLFIRASERDFGVSFWLHAGAMAGAIAFAVNERFRLAGR